MRVIPQLEKRPGSALVLSGGATKAFYFHLGVLKALQSETVTSIVGSSAGAVIGAFIASGATADNLITALHQKRVYLPQFDNWVKTLTSTMLFKPRYQAIAKQSVYTSLAGLRFLASLPTMMNKDILAEAIDRLICSQAHTSGFFDAIALEDLLRSLLPSTDFAEMEIDLYITATCLDCRRRSIFNSRYSFEDQENEFMTDVPIHRAVRASSAIPGMFTPVKIKDKYYIDGEVKRTLSADVGIHLADRVIISHTYQPLYLQGEGTVNDFGWLNIIKQATSIVLQERIDIWREVYSQRYPDKEIIWIEPDPQDIDFFRAPDFSFRPEVQMQMIHCGEQAAHHALQSIQPVSE